MSDLFMNPTLPTPSMPWENDNPLSKIFGTKSPKTPGAHISTGNTGKAASLLQGRQEAIRSASLLPPAPVPTSLNVQPGRLDLSGFSSLLSPPSISFPDAPTPTVNPEDYARLDALMQSARPLSQYLLPQAVNASNLASLGTMSEAVNTLAPPNPTPYNAPPVPSRMQSLIPDRPAPGHNDWASGLAALAGLIAPQHAGEFASAPLSAARQVAEQQFRDAQQRYEAQQQQNAQNYGDAIYNRNDTITGDLRNRALAEAVRQEGNQQTLLQAEAAGKVQGAHSLQNSYEELIPRDEARIGSAVDAGNLAGKIGRDQTTDANASANYGSLVKGLSDLAKQESERRLNVAKFLQSTGSDATRSLLDSQRINNEFSLGQQRNSLAGDMQNLQRSRLAWEIQKYNLDPQRQLDPVVEKDMEVNRAYSRLTGAQKAYNNAAASGTPQERDATEKELRMAEKALEQTKNRAFNRYAPLFGKQPLPIDAQGNPVLSQPPPVRPGSRYSAAPTDNNNVPVYSVGGGR